MPRPWITAPIDFYRDPAIYERERETIFARTWQLLGLEAELARPGDYLADTLAGYPVVVVRDDAGALHGFHNLCRHRAGPLVREPRGRCDHAFVCRFHAWRYAYDGRLLAATDFGPADGFEAAELGLLPIAVEAWRGFVFVNLDPGAESLAAALRPLSDRLGPQMRRPARVRDSHLVACNWKVFVENYLDGYQQGSAEPAAETAAFLTSGEATASGGLWAWVWPNLCISLRRGVLGVESIRPEGPDRLEIDHIFLHEPEDPSVEAAIVDAEEKTEDDSWVSERVQRNLDAGVFRSGVLSPSTESAVAAFQARVARVLAGEPPA